MKNDCTHYREQIPRSLLDDISPEQASSLASHFAECEPCARERDLYAQTIGHLRAHENEEVPRHFFVYPEQSRQPGPWNAFRMMSRAWQGAVAAAFIVLLVAATLALSRLQVRSDNGVYSFSFGNMPAPVAPAPPIDVAALEARVLRLAEDASHRRDLEWIRELRDEIARSERALTAREAQTRRAALALLEDRIGERILETAQALRAESDHSIADLYRTVTYQRVLDLEEVHGRLNRFAVSDEIKSSQTDAILETLLQVAEARLR